MAKVIEFPVKKELPKEAVDRLHEIGKLYVESLDDIVEELCGDITDEEEYSEMVGLMLNALLEGVVDAIDKMGKES